MPDTLFPEHRTPACTGTWARQWVGQQPLWCCSRCGHAFIESVAVLGAVRAEAMLTDLLDELAGAGAELLARERRAG